MERMPANGQLSRRLEFRSESALPSTNGRILDQYGDPLKLATSQRPVLGHPREILVGLFQTAHRILQNSSLARRESREQSRLMLQDQRVAQPYDKMRLTVSSLPGQVVPESQDDPAQVEAARDIHHQLRWENEVEVLQNLMAAYWYGCSGGGLRVQFDERDRRYYVAGMDPVHSDTITFNEDRVVYLMVGQGYEGETHTYGFESRVRPLTQAESEIFVLHVYNPEAPDFFEIQDAANLYRGVGKRDQVWFTWWISHNLERNLVDYAERIALPIPIGRFPEGNDQARAALEEAFLNYKNGKFIMLPKRTSSGEDLFDIQLVDATANVGTELYKWFIGDYTATQLKLAIEGQMLTSETANTGFGSQVANIHRNTWLTYVKYLARGLSQTITTQVIRRIQKWNNIMPDRRFRYELAVDDTDPHAKLQTVKDMYMMNMGNYIKTDEVLAIGGLTKADENDDVLGPNMSGLGLGGAGGGGFGSDGGGGPQVESGMPQGGGRRMAMARVFNG